MDGGGGRWTLRTESSLVSGGDLEDVEDLFRNPRRVGNTAQNMIMGSMPMASSPISSSPSPLRCRTQNIETSYNQQGGALGSDDDFYRTTDSQRQIECSPSDNEQSALSKSSNVHGALLMASLAGKTLAEASEAARVGDHGALATLARNAARKLRALERVSHVVDRYNDTLLAERLSLYLTAWKSLTSKHSAATKQDSLRRAGEIQADLTRQIECTGRTNADLSQRLHASEQRYKDLEHHLGQQRENGSYGGATSSQSPADCSRKCFQSWFSWSKLVGRERMRGSRAVHLISERDAARSLHVCFTRWRGVASAGHGLQVRVMRERLEKADTDCVWLRSQEQALAEHSKRENEEFSELRQQEEHLRSEFQQWRMQATTRSERTDEQAAIERQAHRRQEDMLRAEAHRWQAEEQQLKEEVQRWRVEAGETQRWRAEAHDASRWRAEAEEAGRWRAKAEEAHARSGWIEAEFLRRSNDEFARLREVEAELTSLQADFPQMLGTDNEFVSPTPHAATGSREPRLAAYASVARGVTTSMTDAVAHLLLKLHFAAWHSQVHQRSLALELIAQCGYAEDATQSARAFCCWRLSMEVERRQISADSFCHDKNIKQTSQNEHVTPKVWAEGVRLRNRDEQASGFSTPPQMKVRFSEPTLANGPSNHPLVQKSTTELLHGRSQFQDLSHVGLAEPVADPCAWQRTPTTKLDSPGRSNGGKVLVQCGRARLPAGPLSR